MRFGREPARTHGTAGEPMTRQELARLRTRARRDPGLERQLGLELFQSGSSAVGRADPGSVALLEEAVDVLRATSARQGQRVDGLLVAALAVLGLALMEHRGPGAAEGPLAEVVEVAGNRLDDLTHGEERLALVQSLLLLGRCREESGDLPAARQLVAEADVALAECGDRPGVSELRAAVERVAARLRDDV